jgi:hypothetical protein
MPASISIGKWLPMWTSVTIYVDVGMYMADDYLRARACSERTLLNGRYLALVKARAVMPLQFVSSSVGYQDTVFTLPKKLVQVL